MRSLEIDSVSFDDKGLVPLICQDQQTRSVLMLGYANREALEKTIQTGDIHFYSRSRAELWHKGSTSGNFLKLVSIQMDCDSDALLAVVNPLGPTCHTGANSCFEES
ncbi:MAG: phosphoribosyl-AMP cyclohydrolase [Aquiluna sp.]|nr:phosphoribosyl-AMP cyclohydrolase [Aquiluna sp.]